MNNKKIDTKGRELNPILIADCWGFAADADLFNALNFFFQYLSCENDKEKDLNLRYVNFHLSRISERKNDLRDIEYLSKRQCHMPAVLTKKSVRLEWMTFDSIEVDISDDNIIFEYCLTGRDAEFIKSIYFKVCRINQCLDIIDEIIYEIGYNENEEL